MLNVNSKCSSVTWSSSDKKNVKTVAKSKIPFLFRELWLIGTVSLTEAVVTARAAAVNQSLSLSSLVVWVVFLWLKYIKFCGRVFVCVLGGGGVAGLVYGELIWDRNAKAVINRALPHLLKAHFANLSAVILVGNTNNAGSSVHASHTLQPFVEGYPLFFISILATGNRLVPVSADPCTGSVGTSVSSLMMSFLFSLSACQLSLKTMANDLVALSWTDCPVRCSVWPVSVILLSYFA